MFMPTRGARLSPRPLPPQAEAKKGPGPSPPIWGVLSGPSGPHHTLRCVRVVGSIGNSNVPSCPFLGPTHSIWVPAVTADNPGVAPICDMMRGPLLPWRARLLEMSNSDVIRINYVPPSIRGVPVRVIPLVQVCPKSQDIGFKV